MHTSVDIALVLLYAVAWLIFEYVRLPGARARLAAAPLGARAREYYTTIAIQWALVGLVLARLVVGHVPLRTIGLALPHSALGWAVSAVGMGLVVWGTQKQAQAIRTERGRMVIARSLEKMAWMLPRERREFTAFSLLSVTAGVCEEILFRGHLLAFFDGWIGPILSTLVGVVIFGLGHAYQGKAGIIRTAAVGLFMALVFRGSGSLLVPIIAHALIDYRSGRMIEAGMRQGFTVEAATPAAVA